MNKKLYFYFQETGYFGHRPEIKFQMVEKNDDYDRLIKEDIDCTTFREGGNFYALIVDRTFVIPHSTQNLTIDTLSSLNGVLIISECNNYLSVERYISSTLTATEISHFTGLIGACITIT